MRFEKILILLIFLFAFLFFHNAYYYPVNGGYDATRHLIYGRIISSEFKIPSLEETLEAYNPPLFYFISGFFGQIYAFISGQDFFQAIKIWQYLAVILLLVSGLLWYSIYLEIYPRQKTYAIFFLVLIFSAPVIVKTAVMYSPELFLLFLFSLSFWWFIKKVQKKPSSFNVFILAVFTTLALLTRIPGLILLATIILGFFILYLKKKLNFKKFLRLIMIFLLVIILGNSWYYFGRINAGIYEFGEINVEPKKTPFFQRQPKSFYFDIPFVLMMNWPHRSGFTERPNRLIPIFYSEFWGDYWNYFSQRRFGISVKQIKTNRLLTTKERVANLAWQNRINLPLTLLMIVGFWFTGIKNSWLLLRQQINKRVFTETLLFVCSLLTWICFLYVLIKFPQHWKGDNIKASYMLYNVPIFFYFSIVFLFKNLRKNKILFIIFIFFIIIAILNNLRFDYY